MSLLMSAMIGALSPRARTSSRQCCWTEPRRRAGWPRRSVRSPQRASRSSRLSTAVLDGAQHSTCGVGDVCFSDKPKFTLRQTELRRQGEQGGVCVTGDVEV